MAAPTAEKLSLPTPAPQHAAPSAFTPYLDAFTNLFHPIAHPLARTSDRFYGWKESLGLSQPGTVENLTREVGQVHLANWFFEGARADISKVLSANPAFQLQHSFQLGAQSGKYNFGAIWTNNSTFLQGGVDGTGSVTMRANQSWTGGHTSKLQAQLSGEPGRSMVQVEHDYLGPHFSFNFKSVNPGVVDLTGIHVASILHSVSPRLALGAETVVQHPSPEILESATSFFAKLTSIPSPTAAAAAAGAAAMAPGAGLLLPFTPSWSATAQLQPTGNVQATYYHRLSDKVDVALDFQTVIQPESMMGPAKREALTTLGAKYDFRIATVRAQVDSAWKVGLLLEQRFTPAFVFQLGGEVDHAKNTSRFGVGIMVESTSMSQEEMIAAGMLQQV